MNPPWKSSTPVAVFIGYAMALSLLLPCEPLRCQETDLNPASVFKVPEGLKVTVWARSPSLKNPTNIDIDSRGRIWVAEAVNYRGFNNQDPSTDWHEAGDRIVVLEDTDLDGRADTSSVFVQDEDLVAPLGVAVMDNRILVSCSPHLLMYTDKNRNAKFDPGLDEKKIFLTGFGGFNHDHGLHSVVAGPDGRWYFNAGNAGPHIVTDRSGWTLRAGSSYTGGTPYNTNNTPGLKSDDGRIYVGGLALSILPDATGLSVHSHNFRNNYEICLDSLGNVFQNDNDDQVVSCRTTWLMEHANAGYASTDGSRTWQADRRPGQSIPEAHWHQNDPGVLPYGDLYGAGSPTGMAVYEGDLLGPDFRGMLMSCEAGRNVVWGYHVKPEGAGFQLERFSLLASARDNPEYQWNIREDDPAKWFRPSDIAVGTDGALYVADWFDPVVGGHAMDDRNASGAIYRIAPAEEGTVQRPSFDLSTIEDQIAALKSPAVNVRFAGLERLKEQGESAIPAVVELLNDENPYIQARAVFLLAQLGDAGKERTISLLQSDHTETRLTAFRALKATGENMLPYSSQLASAPSPALRREVALAMRDFSFDSAKDILLQIAEGYDGEDRWYLEAWGTGCEGKKDPMYSAVLGRIGTLPAQWTDAFSDLVWRLHPPRAVSAVVQRVQNPSLGFEARKQALDTLAFIDSKPAAEAMARLSLEGPDDLRDEAAWWIHFRNNNDWRKYDLEVSPAQQAIAITGVALPKEAAHQSPVIHKGDIARIDIDIAGAQRLFLVVTDAGDGNSCDWADWIEPQLVDQNGNIQPLTELNWTEATTGWGEVNVNRNAHGLPLKVDGQSITKGIGTHANSVIVYQLPEGDWVRFQSRAGLDNGGEDLGGTDFPGGNPSVQFAVYYDGHKRRQAAALALNQNHSEINLPDIEALLKLDGDAERGRKLFFERAACSTCHTVQNQGGSLGPDLTQVAGKLNAPAIMEALVNPSASISFGFEGTTLTLKDGDTIQGFLRGAGDPLLIQNIATGTQEAVPQEAISKRETMSQSLMPAAASLGLQPRDLADLTAFLSNLQGTQ